MEREFKIKSKPNKFRIKEMKATQTLALRNQMNFDDMDKNADFFDLILENIEVEFKDNWYPVKEKGREVYYPAGVENDLATIQELINYFINDYLLPVFRESAKSKQD